MTEATGLRERHLWIAVTAVLATSLAWLCAVGALLLVRAYAARLPETLAVLRALSHAASAMGHVAWPAAAAGVVAVWGLLAFGRRAEEGVRHA